MPYKKYWFILFTTNFTFYKTKVASFQIKHKRAVFLVVVGA